MQSTPTTTVSVLGGDDSTDPWGDPSESATVVSSGIPASIVETRVQVTTEEDPQAVAVHYYTGRVPPGTVINKGQRLLDERTNLKYLIDYVNVPHSRVLEMDIRLDLRRVE